MNIVELELWMETEKKVRINIGNYLEINVNSTLSPYICQKTTIRGHLNSKFIRDRNLIAAVEER